MKINQVMARSEQQKENDVKNQEICAKCKKPIKPMIAWVQSNGKLICKKCEYAKRE